MCSNTEYKYAILVTITILSAVNPRLGLLVLLLVPLTWIIRSSYMLITPRIATVEVISSQPYAMPPQKVAFSVERPAQRHHELPSRRLRLQPEYYIKRDTGELVPLVPADELPLDFYGLPRSLISVENSRMVFLGQKGSWTGYYRMKRSK